MNEKIYKTMNQAGTLDIVLGIITIVTGITTGVLLIVHGAVLLRRKADILL